MSKLSGHKDTDFIILQQLNDNELGRVCQANKYVNQLCQDQNFWLKRILHTFKLNGEEVQKMKNFFAFENYRDLYIYLKEFPTILTRGGFATTHIDRDETIEFFKKEELINQIFNDILKKNLPKWIDRDGLLIDLRRNLPNFLLENVYAHQSSSLQNSIDTYLRPLILNRKNKKFISL